MNNEHNQNKLETDYNNYNTNPISKIYQSPKKSNLIPKPNFRNNIVKGKNNYITNSNSNKKNIKKNENEMHEIDYLTQTNEYFKMKGLSLEERIDFEYYTIKIQAFYRGYLTRKRFYSLINNCLKINNGINLLQIIFSNKKYNIFNIIKNFSKNNNNNSNNLRSKPINNPNSLQNNKLLRKLKAIENHFKNANIDTINKIIINIPKIIKKNDTNNLFFKRKFTLKHLITKTEFKINKILNINFEKFKKNALYSKTSIKEEENINNQSENLNIEVLRITKLRNLVRKKIFRNREILHRVFIKYYYSSLYIHLNWYIYVVNQLTYTQNLITPNTTFNRSESLKPDNITRQTIKPVEDNNPFTTKHSNEVDNAIRQSIRTIKKINDSEDPDDALRESIMSINKINDELSKEAIEKQKAERNKHLKDLVVKKLKDIKNDMHKVFTKFYYQGLLIAKQENKEPETIKISGNEENNEINEITKGPTILRGKKNVNANPALDRRNKARNLRKLMMKKEKEKLDKLRFYFYKFHSNGMLFQLKKNAKKNLSAKNLIHNMDDIINIEKKLEEKEKELTYMDKKLIEMEIEKEKLKQKRIEVLKNIFYKTDRQYAIIKKKIFEKWNLRAKILSLSKIKDSLKKSDVKKKKKLKKSTKSKRENKNGNELENEVKEENK